MNKSSKKLFSRFISFCCLAIGVGFMLTPIVSTYRQMKLEHQESTAFLQQKEEEMRFTTIEGKNPEAVVKIPKLNVQALIYDSTNEAVLDKAVGLLPQSGHFLSGKVMGVPALVAHRGTAHLDLFKRLDELQIGDLVEIHFPDKPTLYYKISEEPVTILPDAYEKTFENKPKTGIIRLITCTPYLINSHRLIFTATQTDPPPEQVQSNLESTTKSVTLLDAFKIHQETYFIALCVGLSLFMVGKTIQIILNRKKTKKSEPK